MIEKENCVEEFRFPKEIYNRPGLDHIRYRIGLYSDFRKYLLKELNHSNELANWTHHSPDDPAFALLEGACILSDILTFYQQLYANEAYLRTAKEKESISDLVTLTGYQLSPALAGSATFSVQVKGDKPVTLPPTLPIKADIEGIDQAVIFETKDECVCYPSLNKFHLYSPFFYPEIASPISGSTTEFYLESTAASLNEVPEIKNGDRILIGEISGTDPISDPRMVRNGEIVIVDVVRQIRGRTVFTIKGKLKRTQSSYFLRGYKIRKAYRHFGHNAPAKIVRVNSDGGVSEEITEFIDSVTGKKEFPLDSEIEDMPSGTTVLIRGFFIPNDPVVEQIASGTPNLFQAISGPPNFITQERRMRLTVIRKVMDVYPGSDTRGSHTGSASFITLDQELATRLGPTHFSKIDIRNIEFFEVTGPEIILRSPGNLPTDQKGSILYFNEIDKDTAGKLVGRNLTIVTKNKDPINATILSSPVSGHPNSLRLDKELNYTDFPNEEPITQVFGNLVAADQGERQEEILEAGDERQEFQTFKLSKSPLTYFNSSKDTPPEVPRLQVYVENQLWKQVPTFFDKKSHEHIYVVRQDRNGTSWIQFGDGKTGRRLPTGIGNILARYKIGSGATGKLKSDTTVKALEKTELIEEINLHDEVSGGTRPEQAEKAKESAPGKTLSLGRMVSLKDYESEALSIAGVTKASANLFLRNSIPTIAVVLIAESNGQVIPKSVEKVLIDYDKCRGMQRFPIEIIIASFKFIYVEADYSVDPTYRKEIVEQQIQDVLGVYRKERRGNEKEREREETNNGPDYSRGLFAARQRKFGQAEYATTVEGAIQSVEGVIWTKVKSMYSLGLSDDPEKIVISNKSELNPSITCDDRTQVLRLYHKHLKLNDVSDKKSGKECQ
jgi:hypothetical protein